MFSDSVVSGREAPSVQPRLRAISRYLLSASALVVYVLPAVVHASNFARPAKSKREGREEAGRGETVIYLKRPYSCKGVRTGAQ